MVFDYPYHHGGVTRIIGLSRGLQRQGCRVFLVGVAFDKDLPFWRFSVSEEKIEGMKVMRFYANRLVPFLFFQLLFLLRYLRANPVDIIQAYNPTYVTSLVPLFLKFLKRVKLVLMYDDIVTLRDKLGFPHSWAMSLFEKLACTLADRVAVLTNFQRKHLLERGVPAGKISRIRNLVDVAEAASSLGGGDEVRRSLGLEGKTVLGYVGSLHRRTGLEDMIRVLPFLDKAALLVVGDGDAAEELKELAKGTGVQDKAVFVGRVPHAQVWRYYSAADVLLCPLEDSPANLAVDHMKLYEYLATGRPVIAARVGSVLEVIEDGVNGLLYTPGDLEELSDKISFLASHPEKASELGSAGRESVKSYDLPVITRQWHELYLGVTGRIPILPSTFEREYTSLYLPLEVERALDLIMVYINSRNRVLLCIEDEILLFKLLGRSFRETYVLTDKEEFLHDIKETFQFNAAPWDPSIPIDAAVVALREPRPSSLEELKPVFNSANTVLVLFPLYLRYDLAANRWRVPLGFLRDSLFPILLTRKMKSMGFEVETYGFRSLRSVLLGRLSWLLNLTGRERLADRVYFRFMQSLATDSRLKYLSTLMLAVARRNG
jgi:glycosyltransferase involved in cell wall biosynthesis